jgi:hypothetical protein
VSNTRVTIGVGLCKTKRCCTAPDSLEKLAITVVREVTATGECSREDGEGEVKEIWEICGRSESSATNKSSSLLQVEGATSLGATRKRR